MVRLVHIRSIFVAMAVLFSIQFWSFRGLSDEFYSIVNTVVIILLGLFLMDAKLKNKTPISSSFTIHILLLLILPLISAFGALFYHEQSLLDSLFALKFNFMWLLFFALHRFDVSTKYLIHLLVLVGIVWALLTILQQFTYPEYIFYTRGEEEGQSILRGGVYRFMLHRYQYGVFMVIYFFYEYLKSKHRWNLFFAAVGIIGLYYYGTRQVFVAVVISLFILLLLNNKNRITISLLVTSVVFAGLYLYGSILFDEFVEMTNEDLTEDNVRLIGADFYFSKYWPDDLLSRFIGNGSPYYKNLGYGAEIFRYEKNMDLYRSDIGLIGSYNLYGIFYVLNIVWLNVRLIFYKNYNQENNYLKVIFINTLILLPLAVFYDQVSSIPFYCCIYYLLEKETEGV